MTHTIKHQYDEILYAGLPRLEIHVVYECESEISFDNEGGEESNRLLTISAAVNGLLAHLPAFPLESHGKDCREFLALLRESARQALWAKALEQASAFEAIERPMVANNWQVTGKVRFPFQTGKPERDFVI